MHFSPRAAHEWKLKYIWLALGAMFMWDCAVYSLALARGSIPTALWAARGSVNVLLGGLLAIGLSRVGGWQSAAFLSPRVVFFNATLLGSAFYVDSLSVVYAQARYSFPLSALRLVLTPIGECGR